MGETPLKQIYQIIAVICGSETELIVAKKFQTRLSNPNPNPVKQDLSHSNPIQMHHKFENPPDLNLNPCSSLLWGATHSCRGKTTGHPKLKIQIALINDGICCST